MACFDPIAVRATHPHVATFHDAADARDAAANARKIGLHVGQP
jgi:hypothetical protein